VISKTVLNEPHYLSGPKPNRSFSLASFFCFFSSSFWCSNNFRHFSFPLIFFASLFLFLSFSWCPNNVEAEIFSLFKYEESKKCGVKFRLKRPCFLMMDMNALCSLRLFMVEHRTVLFVLRGLGS